MKQRVGSLRKFIKFYKTLFKLMKRKKENQKTKHNTESLRIIDALSKTTFGRCNMSNACILTAAVTICTRPAQNLAIQNSNMSRQEAYEAPP